MKRFFLLVSVCLCASLHADLEEFQVSKDSREGKRENFFLTSTDARITPKVNPISGEYCEEEIDLVVAGSEPLSSRRFYNHMGPYDPRYASWRYNPEAYLVANFEYAGQMAFAAIGERGGSVCALERSGEPYTFGFQHPEKLTNFQPSGQTHPHNTKISYCRLGDPKNKARFQYSGKVIDGSGSERIFCSPIHQWLSIMDLQVRKSMLGGTEFLYKGPNTWSPYHLPVQEERLPNGNILCYSYEVWKKDSYPRPQLLKSIVAYNAARSKVLGTLTFEYHRIKNNEVGGITIRGSDGRSAFIQHQGKQPIILTSAVRPGAPSVAYGFDRKRLSSVSHPDGRTIETHYNDEGKVSTQNAPVGPHGEMCAIGWYEYHPDATVVRDAEGNCTIYRFDASKRITALETHQNGVLYRADRFTWDSSTGNLIRKTIEDGCGVVIQTTDYQYDKNQNPILETCGARKIARTFSEDGFNLKLTESDRDDQLICYAYVPGTNLLASEIVYNRGARCKRTFHFYDDCAICIRSISDDGTGEDPDDLENVSYRRVTEITPRQRLPCFGLPEVVVEKTVDSAGHEILLSKVIYSYTPFGKVAQEEHYDAEGVHRFTLINEYDANERLISHTDAEGALTRFGYDANNNLISVAGPRQGQHKEITYDLANRPIRKAERQSDGTYLVTKKRYDKLGRVIEEIDVCGNGTRYEYDVMGRLTATIYPDGAIERKQYDILSNVIKEIDPAGYETIKSYDSLGQLLSVHNPDGSEEYFAYNPTGSVATHTDRNGATTYYTYDLFDHVIKTETGPKITTATWTPFCKLSETEGDLVSSYTYDFAGRKIVEQKAYQRVEYTYDTLGRVARIQEGDTTFVNEYDLCDRLIERRTDQTREGYAYDEAGNRTHTFHCLGATTTHFNTQGQPLSIQDPLGHTTTFQYSYENASIETTINPKGVQTLSIHDSCGREAASLKKNARGDVIQSSQNRYDQNGNLTQVTHTLFSGTAPIKTITHLWEYGPNHRLECFREVGQRETRYVYDERGRLKTVVKPNGCSLEHEYDALGRLSRYLTAHVDYSYTYDDKDRVVEVYDHLTQTRTVRRYDPLGNIIEERLANGLTMKNSFDARGRRTRLTLPDETAIDYTYKGLFLYAVSRNGQRHTYSNRDLDGHVIQSTLPYGLGEIIIERDPLGRYTKFISHYYSEDYPSGAYDSTGNLTYYRYRDAQGSTERHYTYDDLDQLLIEDEHLYAFDSLYNRLKKDDNEYDVDDFCQVTHDGKVNYTYDACGNLISDGTRRYVYDGLDRLLAIEEGDIRVEYTYDPFHRRLSKTVYVREAKKCSTNYLWDGDDEIGSVDESGQIQELRVLGEGLGAEIGAAVLLELRGETCIPLHDHRGCLVMLIDLDEQMESYRYTSFGEELTGNKRSPWRFSSKRVDEETGFVYFGRRYYHSDLGRWITQDPEGFDDGPNLYAYVSNCPTTQIDLYGLFSFDTLDCPIVYPYSPPRGLLGYLNYGLPADCVDFRGFEDFYKNKSRLFDLNRDFKCDFPDPPRGGYFFGNGVGNTFKDLGKKALLISQITGYNTCGVYNATHTVPMDAREALMNLWHIRTTPVYLYHEQWDRHFSEHPGEPLWQGCHSQGAAQVRNALEFYPKEKRDLIVVAAFAPFAYIPKDLCMKVRHYVCKADLIPYGDWHGRRECRDTIRYVKYNPFAKQGCHEFMNPIYRKALRQEIRAYKKLLEEHGH